MISQFVLFIDENVIETVYEEGSNETIKIGPRYF